MLAGSPCSRPGRPTSMVAAGRRLCLSDAMRLPARTSLLLIVAAAALVLGYMGYRAVPRGAYSPTDAVYWSISMFYGRVGPTPGGTPWQLDVGRFLALGVVLYAACLAAATILRARIEAWWVKRFARAHAIVIGGGSDAMLAIDALRAAGQKVVVTDVAPRSRDGLGLRAAGAQVVPGDATESSTANDARIGDARLVVVMTGQDQRNLEVLAAAIAALEPGRRAPVLHVALDDVDLWRELSQAALTRDIEIAIEFFNPADRAALAVLAAAGVLAGEYVPAPVLIDGSGPLAVRTVGHIVRRGLLDGRRAELLLSGDSGRRLEAELRRQEPWCFEAGDIRIVDPSNASRALAIVAGSWTDVEALARGAALSRDGSRSAVLVAVKRPSSVEGVGRAGLAPASLHTVSIGAEALASELVESSSIEILARARHEDYLRRGLECGESRDTNPSLVGWEELPQALKESNRRFAETVGAHVSGLGATLRPLAHAPPARLVLDDAVLDDLAQAEHDRWMASLRRDGWRPTRGPKDPTAQLHPLLVPWEDLSELDREKDRDVFRGLPRLLALIGYELVLPAERGHAAKR
jgi:TrkA-N domain/RyR domain